MGRLYHRQTDDVGARVRLLSAGPGPFFRGCWRLLVLLVMTGLGWACGSDPVCPLGTTGSSCMPADDLGAAPDVPMSPEIPTDNDLGAAPDVPMSPQDLPIESASDADDPDQGPLDVEVLEPDSTTQFMREAPDAPRVTPLQTRSFEGVFVARSGPVMEHERAAECAAPTGNHVDSRGAPLWRPNDRVAWGPGPVGWRRAA